MNNKAITPSMIVLLIGGILAILVQLPIVNEALPIVAGEDATIGGIEVKNNGGYNFLGAYGEVEVGGLTGDLDDPDGWTILGLDGILFWLLIIVAGVLCIVPAINKFQPFIPEIEMPVPGGLPFLLAIIGGAIQLLVVLLLFITDPGTDDTKTLGINMMDLPTGSAVGLGFYVMAIAAIVSIVGAVLLYLEETAA